MRKFHLIILAIFSSFTTSAQNIQIETQNTLLIYKVGNNKRLYQSYYGSKNSEQQYPDHRSEAYAAAGMNFEFEPAIRIVHSDGNPSLELKYLNNEVKKHEDGSVLTIIRLKDEVYQTSVDLYFQCYPNQDVIKAWSVITNQEKKEVVLSHYASSMLHFKQTKYWLMQFHGNWAREMQLQEEALTSGIKTIDSKLGVRASKYQSSNFMLSFGKQAANENEGEVLAGSLAYTGSFKLNFEIDPSNNLHLSAGINNYASEYYLKPKETFTTPAFIFTYSNKGKGLASRNLHTWARQYDLLDGNKARLTLLNNWEATGMSFNQENLSRLIDDTKKLGVDMFLLDDGWFGNKYPRDNDQSSLGDWMVDRKKLPDGLSYLVKTATDKGVKFGIWLEPEMISPKSELYEKHPDWVLKLPNRDIHLQRNQLVLDLTNPKVQDYVFEIVDKTFQENPGIAFVKWDCNRTMSNSYSAYLKDRQSHLQIKYVEGLYNVLKKVRAKYPHIPMMLCSGGGGRADYEALKYFTEFWPSDNTDGFDRVYIQWGYSYFFPANTISAHVTNWGRQSLKFRTDVAMSGKLGYDINVANFSEKELLFSQEAVKNYQRLRDVIEQGNIYRLVSPYENNRAVLMYSNLAQNKAVVFCYQLRKEYVESIETVKLQGLNPQQHYQIKEINLMPGNKSQVSCNGKTFTGDYLMTVGIEVSRKNAEALSSTVLELVGVN